MPLEKNYLTDYHIHTQFSDGRSSFREYIDRAIQLGFSEIGFSDHLTFDKSVPEPSIKHALIPHYIDTLIDLRDHYPEIKIKIGFEVDYTPETAETIHQTFEDLPIDYLIGSIHNLGATPIDISPDFYQNKEIYKIWSDYFNAVEATAKSGLFNIIGHLDLVRIFKHTPAQDIRPLYQSLAQTLKKTGVAFEINTNGMNKYLNAFYPDPNYLSIFAEEHVPVCINSDAHAAHLLGQHFTEAYALIKKVGYRETATFSKRALSLITQSL